MNESGIPATNKLITGMPQLPDKVGASITRTSETALFRKISLRLLPFLLLLYVVAYLDRINIGFAKLQMNGELGFSDATYGLGAGVFFIGYFLFEVPSNLILHKVGARVWLARIIALWGIISIATLWVGTPAAFYALRFLLGLGEAGFFPGILYYLTFWYPDSRRAQAVAWFMMAVPVAGVCGGPLSGWIMASMDGSHGLSGWQWLFLLEGLPAVLLGVLTLFWLDDSPASAAWLTEQDKSRLAKILDCERTQRAGLVHREFAAAVKSRRVWSMTLLYFLLVIGLYGISFWMPQIIHELRRGSYTATGWLSTIPYVVAAAGMVLIGGSSDRHGERRWHLALCALAGAAGFIGAMLWENSLAGSLMSLSLAALGALSALAVFWPLPASLLQGRAAAGGIALINSVGNLGGYISPAVMGWLKDLTGHMASGLLMLAAALTGAAVLGLVIARNATARQ